MIRLKSEDDILILKENALLVSRTLAEVGKHIKPGVTTLELDRIAETFIRDNGAEPAFLGYGGFPFTLCLSVNEIIVHGFPSEYRLCDGDIISVDCGTKYKGFYGDSAYTFPVGEITEEAKTLLRVTKESLFKGIEKSVSGNRIGDVSNAVQEHVEKFGFSVVREMVGHGIGKKLHEAPEVPNYGRRGEGKKMSEGLVICIEPMVNAGTRSVFLKDDGWSLSTADKKYSAHYELMVLVRKGNAEVLSTFDFIEKNDIKL